MVQDTPDSRRTTGKSEAAFRTISEVAEELDVPQHVLRFWETKFSQIRPMKRGGGRRYYRPEDVALLRRIRGLLYEDGFTIKGVQKLLREGGAKAVIAAPAADVAMIGEGAHHAPSAPGESQQTAMDLGPASGPPPVLTRALDDASAPSAAVDAFAHDDDHEALLDDDASGFDLASALASAASFASASPSPHPVASMSASLAPAGDDALDEPAIASAPSSEHRASGDLIAALEAKARRDGLDARTRAVVEDVLGDLLAVRDLLNNALQATAMK